MVSVFIISQGEKIIMGLFGPDKITLTLEKFDFKPGESIKGHVTLNLKKPVQARKLQVSLIGKRKSTSYHNGRRSTNYTTVFDFDLPIGGEKEYQNEQVPFEIKIPSTILNSENYKEKMTDALEDKLGSVGSIIGAMAVGASHINWEVKAQLDVPMKLDVKKSQDIIISD